MSLDNFRKKHKEYDHISDDWLIWFIGYFEGNGGFTIERMVGLVFVEHELNRNVLEEIRDKFGFGRIKVHGKHIVPGRLWGYSLEIKDLRGLGIILTLFKGNLVLPGRIKYYNVFVKEYNVRLEKAFSSINYVRKKRLAIAVGQRSYDFAYSKFKIEEATLQDGSSTEQIYPTKDDAWFSGFTDADVNGSFYTSFKRNFDLVYSYNVECTKVDSDNFLKDLKEPLLSRGNYKFDNHGIIFDTEDGMEDLWNYFDRYSLKTLKLYDYFLVKHVSREWEKRTTFSDEELENLVNLVKRTQITTVKGRKRDWDNVLQKVLEKVKREKVKEKILLEKTLKKEEREKAKQQILLEKALEKEKREKAKQQILLEKALEKEKREKGKLEKLLEEVKKKK